jgi:hypothetical protein
MRGIRRHVAERKHRACCATAGASLHLSWSCILLSAVVRRKMRESRRETRVTIPSSINTHRVSNEFASDHNASPPFTPLFTFTIPIPISVSSPPHTPSPISISALANDASGAAHGAWEYAIAIRGTDLQNTAGGGIWWDIECGGVAGCSGGKTVVEWSRSESQGRGRRNTRTCPGGRMYSMTEARKRYSKVQ